MNSNLRLQAKEAEMKQQGETLLNQITDLKQRHEIELIERQAKMYEVQEKKIQEREIMHKEEVEALTQEWHVERKVSIELEPDTRKDDNI